jgi:hypothetical protein
MADALLSDHVEEGIASIFGLSARANIGIRGSSLRKLVLPSSFPFLETPGGDVGVCPTHRSPYGFS